MLCEGKVFRTITNGCKKKLWSKGRDRSQTVVQLIYFFNLPKELIQKNTEVNAEADSVKMSLFQLPRMPQLFLVYTL